MPNIYRWKYWHIAFKEAINKQEINVIATEAYMIEGLNTSEGGWGRGGRGVEGCGFTQAGTFSARTCSYLLRIYNVFFYGLIVTLKKY